MANDYFKFKQFTVKQDMCAMKVCTDSCLFGAWSANQIKNDASLKSMADIGCGTGLLSLMLAQKTNASIDAIEIDKNASLQTKENFDDSPWKERLTVWHTSLQQFEPKNQYDFIISNPPFFENDLVSTNIRKNAAKHHTEMKISDLMTFINKRLSINGYFSLLLPYHRTAFAEDQFNSAELFITRKALIRQSPAHSFFRTIFLMSRKKIATPEVEEITIHDANREYTREFRNLLGDYYLNL